MRLTKLTTDGACDARVVCRCVHVGRGSGERRDEDTIICLSVLSRLVMSDAKEL